MDEQEVQTGKLYAHLSSTGNSYVIADDTALGLWVELPRLKAELQRLQDTNGALYLSVDDVPVEKGDPLDTLLALVTSYQVRIYNVQRAPGVTGYDRSFIDNLSEAVDRAYTDVEGTKMLLEQTQYWLNELSPGTKDYSFWESEEVRLKKQLEFATLAHKKLKDLELELTIDPVGGEN